VTIVTTEGSAGLREIQKERRRRAIVDAAFELLSERDESDVSNADIAARAGVTAPTIYNLVGNRMDVLMAIMADLMHVLHDRLAELGGGPPLVATEEALAVIVRLFVADEAVYRQIVRRINGLEIGLRPAFAPHPLDILDRAMADAAKQGCFLRGIQPDQVARQIFLSFAGASADWSVGWMTGDQFHAEVMHGLHTTFAAVCRDDIRADSLKQLRKIGKRLRGLENHNPRPHQK